MNWFHNSETTLPGRGGWEAGGWTRACLLHSGPHLDGDAGVVLLQVLQADLQVQLTGPSNDVLPGFFNDALEEDRHSSAPGPYTLNNHLGTEETCWEPRLQAPLQLEVRGEAIRAHGRQNRPLDLFFAGSQL